MDEFFDTPQQNNESFDFGRYFKGIVKRWWLVGLVSLVIIIPAYLKLKSEAPVFKADVWISFERVTGLPQNLIQSRMLQLKSRTFAEEITANLGLTLNLMQEDGWPHLFRQDVFTKFATSEDPMAGEYTLRLYPTGYCALYHENVRLDSLRADRVIRDTLSVNGFSFLLNPEIGAERPLVRFRIEDFKSTVSELRDRIDVTFNREGDVMHLSLKDSDPVVAAQTVNMLAQIFIDKSISMSQDRSRDRLNYLKSQLQLVESQLSVIDRRLKAFSDDHLMGLDEEKRKAVAELRTLEADTAMIGLYIRDLKQLLGKFDYNDPNFDTDNLGHYIFRQISILPAFENDQVMDLARRRLGDYDDQLKEMDNLPKKNPAVIELTEKVQEVEGQVFDLAKRKITELEIEDTKKLAEIRKRLAILASLPEENMARLDLVRQQKVKEEVHSRLLRQVQEAQVSNELASENVSIVDKAVPVFKPLSANRRNKGMMAAAAALLAGILVALSLELADKRIKNRSDIKRHLDLPIIGVIPKVKFDNVYDMADSEKAKSISSQIVTHDYSPTPVGEAYRSLRTSLLFNKNHGELKTMAIGSVMPGEGKSFTAANLAITLAQQKSRTLLVDADLRRGVLHNSFSCPKKPGLTNYLTGVVPVENILNDTYVPNLTLITCGSLLPNPSELLGSDRMKRLIEILKEQYDFIIFDTPPLMAATDSIILSTLVDGFAMLVRSGMTNRNDVKRKLELFTNLQSNVLGVILNCAGVDVAHEGYSYYRY